MGHLNQSGARALDGARGRGVGKPRRLEARVAHSLFTLCPHAIGRTILYVHLYTPYLLWRTRRAQRHVESVGTRLSLYSRTIRCMSVCVSERDRRERRDERGTDDGIGSAVHE